MGIPTNLSYTKEHEWLKIDGEIAKIGITNYAQDALGDIVFLELPEVGASFNAGDALGVVESVKAVSDIYAPLSGEIVEINQPLTDAPETINSDPYNEGWMVKMKISSPEEVDGMMDAAAYETFLAEESE